MVCVVVGPQLSISKTHQNPQVEFYSIGQQFPTVPLKPTSTRLFSASVTIGSFSKGNHTIFVLDVFFFFFFLSIMSPKPIHPVVCIRLVSPFRE